MPAILGALMGGGGAEAVTAIVRLQIATSGAEGITKLVGMFGGLSNALLKLGITTIFVDRLVQALRRAWEGLNEAMGATKMAEDAIAYKRTAEMIEVQTSALEALTEASKKYGGELPDIVTLLGKVQEKTMKFKENSADVVDALKGSGLTPRDFDGLDAMSRLMVLSRALKNMPADQRMRTMKALFEDDITKKLGPLLASGPEKMLAEMQEARALGAVMSKAQIASATLFAMAMGKLDMVMTGLSRNVATIFMPTLIWIANGLTYVFGRLSSFVGNNAGVWADRLSGALHRVFDPIVRFVKWWDLRVKPMDETLVRIAYGFGLLTSALAALAFGPTVGKFSMILYYLFRASLWAEDIATWLRGGKSHIGEIIDKAPAITAFMGMLVMLFGQLKSLVGEVWAAVTEFFTSPTGMFLMYLALGGITLVIRGLRHIFGIATNFFRIVDGVVQALLVMLKLIAGIGGSAIGLAVGGDFEKASNDILARGWTGAWNLIPDLLRGAGEYSYQSKDLLGMLPGDTTSNNTTKHVNVVNNTTIKSDDVDRTYDNVQKGTLGYTRALLENY